MKNELICKCNFFLKTLLTFTFLFLIADITSKSKFHISIGHETVLAKLTLFGCPTNINQDHHSNQDNVKELSENFKTITVDGQSNPNPIIFDMNNEYKVVPNISCDKEEENAKKGADKATYGLLEFERPVVIIPGCKGT